MAITEMEAHRKPAREENLPPEARPESRRYVALDAYPGFIMLILASEGFGFSALQGDPTWGRIARWFHHVPWDGGVFWDMIQPAFMFMRGVAMPLALAKRTELGATERDNLRHILCDQSVSLS
jgi:heparan-alpha-glucosaminide N-acetyltransferase